jgi:hypothetical protein
LELLIIRALFVLVVGLASYFLEPFGLTRLVDAVVGVALGGAVILFEIRLRSVSLKRLIGSAIGSVLGIIGAYLFCAVIRYSIQSGPTQSFLQLTVILIMSYVGLIVGASKGDLLNLSALGGIFGGEKQGRRYCRNRIPRWCADDSIVCPARTTTGGRFGRLAEAQSRPPRT